MRVLVVSPHMDDETLGAGGTLCRHADNGDAVYWLNISNTTEENGFDAQLVQKREAQRQRVVSMYPIEKAFDLKLAPTKLDKYEDGEIIGRIASVIEEVEPERLILPYCHDVHSDHGRVFSWLKPFTKSFRYKYIKQILMMEVLSETDFSLPENAFSPDYFVDISKYMQKKLQIMSVYEQELGEHPFPRNLADLEALAGLRGVVGGVQYAEAFKVLRFIEK